MEIQQRNNQVDAVVALLKQAEEPAKQSHYMCMCVWVRGVQVERGGGGKTDEAHRVRHALVIIMASIISSRQ